jgi:hypothetical protein
MSLDPAHVRSRLEGWQVRASQAITDEDPDLGSVLETWTVDLEPDAAARFADLAQEAYDAWQGQALDLLADAIARAYREAVDV